MAERIRSRKIIQASIGLLAGFLIPSQCGAAELKMRSIPADYGASPKIIGGKLAKQTEWPATLVFTTDSGDFCTATIVGERILITAAHCVVENSVGQVTWNNKHIKVDCKPHPHYDDRPRSSNDLPCHLRVFSTEFGACTADVALCVPVCEPGSPDCVRNFEPAGGKFERIKLSSPAAIKDQSIVLLGYGCIHPNEKPTGDLTVGPAQVIQMSEPQAPASTGSNNALRRFIVTKGSGLCNGDSGGAAYSSRTKSSREIIGINSRGNLTSGSDLVNLTDPEIVSFFEDFASKNDGLEICGRDPKATNCLF
jgi:hypothetical protein